MKLEFPMVTIRFRTWKMCPCHDCRALSIHVVSFRGAERNRRRGFHNRSITYQHFHQGHVAPS